MRRIGLIGGMSWESTALYYKYINEEVAKRLGKAHSAELVLFSVDFEQIVQFQQAGDWQKAGDILGKAALSLRHAGAETIVLCTNTMHKIYEVIEEKSGLPLLHIADATAKAITNKGLSKIGLLATKYTMEQDFIKARLEQHGLTIITPNEQDRLEVHRIIYDELCKGVISDASRKTYQQIIGRLVDQGAEGIILGCTEIGLLIGENDCTLPLFDTTKLHAKQAVDWALTPSARL